MADLAQEGMDLSDAEATALAKRVVAEHLNVVADWLQWEDFPELGEYAFERLDRAVVSEVRRLSEASRNHDRATGIDSQWLKGRANG